MSKQDKFKQLETFSPHCLVSQQLSYKLSFLRVPLCGFFSSGYYIKITSY